jgi:hypothetical protein
MKALIRTYIKPGNYAPHRWQCDLFPEGGSDYHGLGATEAEAIFNASIAYRIDTDEAVAAALPNGE